MTEKLEIIAEWYLPANKEQKVHGKLIFDPKDGTTLELYSSLSRDNFYSEFKNQEIILGLTSDSKPVTLCNCNMTKFSGATLVQGGESGKPSTTYSVRYLLIGFHFDTVDDLKFTSISSDIFNLGEWVGISGFKLKNFDPKTKNYKVVVEYKLPADIEFQIDSNTKGTFNFISNDPGLSRYQKSVTINQRVEFQATSAKEKGIDELLKYVITFQNFLTLALYKTTYWLSISLSSELHQEKYGDGKSFKKSIKLYFPSRNFKVNEEPKLDPEMLFDYQRIKSDFPTIIKNWYAKYELLEPAFDLVLEQFYN